MAVVLPKDVQKRIKTTIYRKADEFGYATAGRVENGRFMNELMEDPEVGGVLKEYMEKGKIRTYIKDGVLNSYTKAKKKEALTATTPEGVVKRLFKESADIIQTCSGKQAGLYVLRATNGNIFVVSSGTVLKWETALRKALEIIASEPGLSEKRSPKIGLKLADTSNSLTDAVKT